MSKANDPMKFDPRSVKTTLIPGSLFFLCLCIFCGCAIFGLKKQIAPLTNAAYLTGRVDHESPAPSRMAVVVYSERRGKMWINRYKLFNQSGEFRFAVRPGTYQVAAFEDKDNDFIYDPGEEAAVRFKDPIRITLTSAQMVSDINLRISRETSERLDIPVNLSIVAKGEGTTRQQTRLGQVVTLDDPLFDDQSGSQGLWEFTTFMKKVKGGLFFLEPYSPDKIPVLFVHGYTGTPRDFNYIAEKIDRKKFQPWFYFYPSAPRISMAANYLNSAIVHLQMTYGFRHLCVVGYSMGGLVSRKFILQNAAEQSVFDIPVFISISTPWNGSRIADLKMFSPAKVPSWEDLTPDSEFLKSLFSSQLSKSTEFYLFFSFKGDRLPIRPNNDEFITLESALLPRAQNEAVRICAFNKTHDNIVDADQVADKLNEILEDWYRREFLTGKDETKGNVKSADTRTPTAGPSEANPGML